jgi:cytoskeleton protein RodZ
MGSLDFAALRRAEVGSRLRVARERQGLSLADIEIATKVPARHLEALEHGDAGTLPSPAYAAGFIRAYARHLGLDAPALVRAYRGEEETPAAEIAVAAPAEPVPNTPFYPPVVIPQPRALRGPLLIGGAVAVGLLLVILIAALVWGRPTPSGTTVELPPLVATATPRTSSVEQALPPLRAISVTVSSRSRVWMRVYEPGGRTLFSGILAPGGSFRVPQDARDPRLSIGYPGALAITVGGAPVAGLGDTRAVSGARLSPAALRAPKQVTSSKRDRRQRRRHAGEALPALEVTTEAAAPSVTTPLGNAQ